jgi:mono/diheme cytochrome c family protein
MSLTFRLVVASLCATAIIDASSATAADLIIDVGARRVLTTEALLRRPDVATIEVPADVSYQRAMTYRAVPLRALLAVDALRPYQELQITASDGFVTHLPSSLVFDADKKGAEPWLAIEPPDKPWPRTPTNLSVGPFYLVWLHPAASGVMSEQWPFQVDSIRAVETRAARWPQLAVGDDVPADSHVRSGQTLFATQCMVCHRLGGAGDATIGPDLNMPHNPTDYLQPWALKALIRNPASLRAWPEMKMPSFDAKMLSDADLDAIIAYLGYMSKRRP